MYLAVGVNMYQMLSTLICIKCYRRYNVSNVIDNMYHMFSTMIPRTNSDFLFKIYIILLIMFGYKYLKLRDKNIQSDNQDE